jgi:hypothetical protein
MAAAVWCIAANKRMPALNFYAPHFYLSNDVRLIPSDPTGFAQ